jgi:hypothetical protein
MLIKEIIALYSENYTKPINLLRGKDAELLIVKAGSTYAYYYFSKCYISVQNTEIFLYELLWTERIYIALLRMFILLFLSDRRWKLLIVRPLSLALTYLGLQYHVLEMLKKIRENSPCSSCLLTFTLIELYQDLISDCLSGCLDVGGGKGLASTVLAVNLLSFSCNGRLCRRS